MKLVSELDRMAILSVESVLIVRFCKPEEGCCAITEPARLTRATTVRMNFTKSGAIECSPISSEWLGAFPMLSGIRRMVSAK